MNDLKLSVVIPCLNERETILKVVDDADLYARKCLPEQYEIIVADNGSTDGTLELLKTTKTPLKIVNVPVRGYGAALHWGICSAKGEYVMFGDADMSYPFSNLEKFKPLIEEGADLILGSRLKGTIEPRSMPLLNRYLGTPVLTALIRWIYKLPTSDCNSGMRIIRRSFYSGLKMRNPGMEWASELLIKTAMNQGSYLETNIDFKKDQRNRPPHLSRWADGWRHLKSIVLHKPQVLYPFVLLFPLIGFALINTSFAMTFFFLMLTTILVLGITAIKLLVSSLENSSGRTSRLLQKFSTVQVVLLFCTGLFASIFFIPDEHMGTKLIVASIVTTILLWLFFIETLKTFLVNRLPDPKGIKGHIDV